MGFALFHAKLSGGGVDGAEVGFGDAFEFLDDGALLFFGGGIMPFQDGLLARCQGRSGGGGNW